MAGLKKHQKCKHIQNFALSVLLTNNMTQLILSFLERKKGMARGQINTTLVF